MPYVNKDIREELEYPLNVMSGHLESLLLNNKENRAGILNYVITSLIDSAYGPLVDAKYKDYNEAIGMLECCKLEFYRKAVSPYEDLKERENGKVLDNIRSEKNSENIPKNNGLDFFNYLVERNEWIIIKNTLCFLRESCFEVLYIDQITKTLKKGDSGIMTYGQHVSCYAEYNPTKNTISKEYFNNLDLNNLLFIPENMIADLIRSKKDIYKFAEELKNKNGK